MKVYVVFWSNSMEVVMEKVFAEEIKAQDYIDTKNRVTGGDWFYHRMEVEGCN